MKPPIAIKPTAIAVALTLCGCPSIPPLYPRGACPASVTPKDSDGKDVEGCLAQTYHGLYRCTAKDLAYVTPGSVFELQNEVIKAKARDPLIKLKVVGGRHSATDTFCTDGVLFDLARLGQIGQADKSEKAESPAWDFKLVADAQSQEELLDAPAGALLFDAEGWLNQQGKSRFFVMPGFRKVTLAGALATGVHGSSWVESSLLTSYVRYLDVMGPEGSLFRYKFDSNTGVLSRYPIAIDAGGAYTVSAVSSPLTLPVGLSEKELWSALRLNLGLLGIVVRVGIKIEDFRWLTVASLQLPSDKELVEQPLADDVQLGNVKRAYDRLHDQLQEGLGRFGQRDCDFFQMIWFPRAAPGRGVVDGKEHGGRLTLMCGVRMTDAELGQLCSERASAGKSGSQLHFSTLAAGAGPKSPKLPAVCDGVVAQRPVENSLLNPHLGGYEKVSRNFALSYLSSAAARPSPFSSTDINKKCETLEKIRATRALFRDSGAGDRLETKQGEVLYTAGMPRYMVSSEFAKEGTEISQLDYEFAVPEKAWPEAISEIKRRSIRDQLCLPLIGLFLRFTKVDDSGLLGHATAAPPAAPGAKPHRFVAGERAMFVDYVVFSPRYRVNETVSLSEIGADMRYHLPYRDMGEDLIRRFGGRPHWGKNADWWMVNAPDKYRDEPSVFSYFLECSQHQLGCDPNFAVQHEKFRKAIGVLDQLGNFQNRYSTAIGLSPLVGREPTVPQDRVPAIDSSLLVPREPIIKKQRALE